MANKTAVNVQPLADRVVVLPLEDEEQMRGGLYIPDTAKEKPLEADVFAVGPGKVSDKGKRVPIGVEVGNRVLIGQYAGTEVEVDGEEYVIVQEDDVLGIVDK